jgi:hypothetical protein
VANFPSSADNLPTTITPSTPQSGVHADLHDKTSDAVNAVETALLPGGAIRSIIDAKAGGTHTHVETDVTNLTADLTATEKTANKNAASGYAGLDGSSKLVPGLPNGAVTGAIAAIDIARFTSTAPPQNIVFVKLGTTRAQINTFSSNLNAGGGGAMFFEQGTYTVDGTVLLYPNVHYFFNWATVKLANATNTNVVETANFAAATGTASNNLDTNIHIYHLNIDGNKANQTLGNGIGLAMYSQACYVDGLTAHHCRGPGLWKERNGQTTGLSGLEWLTFDGIRDVWLYNNGTNGAGTRTGALAPTNSNYAAAQVSAQYCHFATDDVAEQVFIWSADSTATGQRALLVGSSATGQGGTLQLSGGHFWLNHDVQVDVFGNPNYFVNSQFEGGNINLLMRCTGSVFAANRVYLTFASGTNVKLDTSAKVNNFQGQLSTVGASGFHWNFASDGGFNIIFSPSLQASGSATLTTGTIAASDTAYITNGGGGGTLTGASVRQTGTG